MYSMCVDNLCVCACFHTGSGSGVGSGSGIGSETLRKVGAGSGSEKNHSGSTTLQKRPIKKFRPNENLCQAPPPPLIRIRKLKLHNKIESRSMK